MVDSFTARHVSGPCSNVDFVNHSLAWAGRSRISIVTGEKIEVTLFGDGADLALDATGANIFEWISARGTTTHYQPPRIMFGGIVPKGYVSIMIKATSSLGLGNRTVTVSWLTGTETIQLKIVADCTGLAGTGYRVADLAPSQGYIPGIVVIANPSTPNLLPHRDPSVLARPFGQVISTPDGGMTQVDSSFGAGLADNVVTAVPVPDLTWGVSGVNAELANTQFEVQLIDVSDANNPRVLDLLNLPNGFPANTQLVTKQNYPGRPASIRVIRNPRFRIGPAVQTFAGCFTEPGSPQALDPTKLLLSVDSNNQINEGSKENDNELFF